MTDTRLPPAGPHGGDGARVAAALGIGPAEVLDLSASMNPVAPDPRPVVARHLDALARYPDAGAATATLAEVTGIGADRLLLTNGGAEAIALVAAETGPGWADPCDFSLYRRHLPRLDPAGRRWRSDPHNPLGTLAGPDAAAEVWDEAFYPLATGRWTGGRPGFALGSLTKLLACPGLRVGYVVCPDGAVRERLAARQPRWAVNGLACAALPELLAPVDLPGWAATIAGLRADLVGVLETAGLRVRPGATANWVLVDATPGLRGRLAACGVVVRDCTSFGLPGTHRIAVPPARHLPRLADALRESARRDGELGEGTLRDGELGEGTLRDGWLREGTLLDGELLDGELLDGQPRDGGLGVGGPRREAGREVGLPPDGHGDPDERAAGRGEPS